MTTIKRYEEMPRDELIQELMVWRFNFDKKVSEEVGEQVLKQRDKLMKKSWEYTKQTELVKAGFRKFMESSKIDDELDYLEAVINDLDVSEKPKHSWRCGPHLETGPIYKGQITKVRELLNQIDIEVQALKEYK